MQGAILRGRRRPESSYLEHVQRVDAGICHPEVGADVNGGQYWMSVERVAQRPDSNVSEVIQASDIATNPGAL